MVMARKQRDDDEDIERDDAEVEEEAEAEEESEAQEEQAIEEEPAEEEEAALEEEVDEPRHDDEEPPEEAENIELPPRPRTPVLTVVLLILNALMVPVFLILLVADYSGRQQWAQATFINRLYLYGLPLQEEEANASLWYGTRPRLRLDGDKLKAAYASRPHPGAPSFSDPFQPVDTVEEPLSFHIRPSQIDDQVKGDLFRLNGLGDPVATIDDEVARLKRTVPQAIQDAAAKFAEATPPADKKKKVEQILLPLAWSVKQVDVLQDRINNANDAELDALLKEAVERRLLTDFMAPVNIYRPGDMSKFPVEKVADLDIKIEELRDLLVKRFVYVGAEFDGKPRDDIEKRHAIAFLMVALSQLKVPGATEPLFPKGLERAQVINGLYEFTQAAANYPRTLQALNNRVLDVIVTERDGYLLTSGKGLTRTETGFTEQHSAEIERLKKEKAAIVFTQNRIKELTKQRDFYAVQYKQRLALLGDVTKQLLQAKADTAKLHAEVDDMNQQMYRSLRYLSKAQEENDSLEARIAGTEKELMPKGGKR
jgi:hypothetical protein